MKTKRDDFDWLVTSLEERKSNRNVRTRPLYAFQEYTTSNATAGSDVSQWRRKRLGKKREHLLLILYLVILILGTLVPLLLH